MKKKNNKDIILFILIIPIFLFLTFYITNRMEKSQPYYSVLNKSKMGYSVFYDALIEFKYPAERTLKPLSEFKTNSVQIIPPGGKFNINNQEVKQFVEKGGILVNLAHKIDPPIEYGTTVSTNGNIKQYKYHKGSIINADVDSLTNITLTKDTSSAYKLLKEISNLSYEKIYFNENYLFSSSISNSLWDIIPLQIKYIIYQILIALVAFFYYKGKSFGKNILLHEEVERSENEYLFSAAALYRQAKCYDLMVYNYYKNFLKGFEGNSEEWLEYWEKEKIPSLHQATNVYEFMKNKNTSLKAKEYIQIVSMIEHLNKILDKRSDMHWKTLKVNLHEKLQKK